eukprot:364163-Chlamydomonas_euryale.AAC.13
MGIAGQKTVPAHQDEGTLPSASVQLPNRQRLTTSSRRAVVTHHQAVRHGDDAALHPLKSCRKVAKHDRFWIVCDHLHAQTRVNDKWQRMCPRQTHALWGVVRMRIHSHMHICALSGEDALSCRTCTRPPHKPMAPNIIQHLHCHAVGELRTEQTAILHVRQQLQHALLRDMRVKQHRVPILVACGQTGRGAHIAVAITVNVHAYANQKMCTNYAHACMCGCMPMHASTHARQQGRLPKPCLLVQAAQARCQYARHVTHTPWSGWWKKPKGMPVTGLTS